MSKAFVVGEKPLIQGFKGVGFEIVHADSAESLLKALNRLARDPETSLVLVTESAAAENPEALRQFRETSKAILTTLPTHLGSGHLGFKEMRKMVEHSIGVDMLGKE